MKNEGEFGIKETCNKLNDRLVEYIESVYFGKNEELRNACKKYLKKEGTLHQTPFVEVSPAYKTAENGILYSADIPNDCKKPLREMTEAKLGVFTTPYCHQIDALNYYCQGKDIFVATGTGSGKTECFMWPIVTKLLDEAANNDQWNEQEGIRVLMMYPMNALVSDQLGRLRKMIGVEKFHEIFRENTGKFRIPKFGMYTGRTLYPGPWDKKNNKDFAKTLENDILKKNEKFKEKLKEMGRYPSKHDLEEYVNKLNSGIRETDSEDSELLLRYEMQDVCPDILITNYSMLELMLLRPIESPLWEKTSQWLKSNPKNKLLFVIDEAHMYRGSSGGEVSLLIRRVMNRLGVDREKFQFILTSASVPSDADEKVLEFANALSSQDPEKNNFIVIRGTDEPYPDEDLFDISPERICNIDLGPFREDNTVCSALESFFDYGGLDKKGVSFDSLEDIEHALYNKLQHCTQIITLQKQCRGNATCYNDLPALVYPNAELSIAERALDVLLTVSHFAKNNRGQVLLPTRLHLFFKGLDGVFACINPECTEKTDTVPHLGKIYLDKTTDKCKCGGLIYEIVNDRSCGQLFVKGFIDFSLNDGKFLWNNPGLAKPREVTETHLCFGMSSKSSYRTIVVDSKTGYICPDMSNDGKPGYITLFYNPKSDYKDRENLRSFWTCPKCERTQMNATDFSTKGNDPFFNIVSKQLSIQPPTLFAEPEIKSTPNQGRKVLLFSDSRQNAAVLAKDLSDLSTTECTRSAICLASQNLEKWGKEEGKPIELTYLYPALLSIFKKYSLNLFIDNVQKEIEQHLKKVEDELEDEEYDEIAKNVNIPDRIRLEILNHLCSQYNSLTDLALCWVEPRERIFKKLKWDIIGEEHKEEVRILFSAWANYYMKDTYALDLFNDDLIDDLDRPVSRFGIPDGYNCLDRFKAILSKNNYSEEAIEQIRIGFEKTLEVKGANNNRFIMASSISLRCDPYRTWYECKSCGRIFPFKLFNKCSNCFCENVEEISDYSSINFLRKPVLSVLSGTNLDPLKIINVEEHTAQLSHKDQLSKMWSTTEDYELRFQNVYTDNMKPVDILSCTTTMEVGIDIGSLTAVGMRNVPPSRENYQQRAGRAGRRGASVSTIVTYSDKGRYDRHYFEHPHEIVSGKPRTPFIDYRNKKLAIRHTTISLISEFFRTLENNEPDLEKMPSNEFIDSYYGQCKDYITKRLESMRKGETQSVLPSILRSIQDADFDKTLLNRLEEFRVRIESNKEMYSGLTFLDAAHDMGLISTYSFPRHLINFNIMKREEKHGKSLLSLEERPERQLDVALSEYAPGRSVYVNKRKYISGAIASINPLTGYEQKVSTIIHDDNYRKDIQRCINSACSWFGFTSKDQCPFCGGQIVTNTMLTPHGFAPLLPMSRIREGKLHFTNTYAGNPCYSTMPASTKDMIPYSKNLRYELRSNQNLVVLNTGIKNKGFTICPDCGAAVNGNEDEFNRVKPESPFPEGFRCYHKNPLVKAMLGCEFLTDLIVFEIKLDPKEIVSDESNLWLTQAAKSLSHAFCLAAGDILDAEANDLKNGYRILGDGRNVVEIYLYDNLSSGAGYSAEIANKVDELIESVRKLLTGCDCDSACFKCLKNYTNRFDHDYLDRYAALDLLNWAISGILPDPLSREVQETLLIPLDNLMKIDHSKVCVYPSAWSESKVSTSGKINLSEFKLNKQTPLAYSTLVEKVGFGD